MNLAQSGELFAAVCSSTCTGLCVFFALSKSEACIKVQVKNFQNPSDLSNFTKPNNV